jgi:hypothetical protein
VVVQSADSVEKYHSAGDLLSARELVKSAGVLNIRFTMFNSGDLLLAPFV